MKVVILAGGFGTRIVEESHLKPKPMIEIADKPILWHIMKIYSYYGFNDFVVCLGYKGYIIKEYFYNYFLHNCDISFDLRTQGMEIHKNSAESWHVTLIDTGLSTMTGGRIKRIQPYLNKETFMLTYGDGVANIDIPNLLAYHKRHKKLATLTAVQPQGRFGSLQIDGEQSVKSFTEKTGGDGAWFNGGFFVLEPGIFDYIDGDQTLFEQEPLESLAKAEQLKAYEHAGFWQPMDTLRDKNLLEQLWQTNQAPWKIW